MRGAIKYRVEGAGAMGRHYFYTHYSINFLAPFQYDEFVGLRKKTADERGDERRFNASEYVQRFARRCRANLKNL